MFNIVSYADIIMIISVILYFIGVVTLELAFARLNNEAVTGDVDGPTKTQRNVSTCYQLVHRRVTITTDYLLIRRDLGEKWYLPDAFWFLNFFDSIRKNDAEQRDTYRTILEEETRKEQQIFDSTKDELRSARSKNANKHSPFHHENSHSDEEGVELKREARLGRIEPVDQPGCPYTEATMIFYENHAHYVKNKPDKNWLCHEPYWKLLHYCYEIYKIYSDAKKVVSNCTITRDEDTVDKECKTHTLTFWHPSSSAEEDRHAWNVTLDINLFYCPINKMGFKFPRGDKPYEVLDFYVAEGRNEETVAMLHKSNSSDNICLTDIYRLRRYFFKDMFPRK